MVVSAKFGKVRQIQVKFSRFMKVRQSSAKFGRYK